MSFSLQIDGVSKTAAQLGAESINLNLLNLGHSTMGISIKPGALNQEPAMTFGQAVKLFEDATCRFVGEVSATPKNALVGRVETLKYTVSDIFYSLDRIIYEQDWHYDAGNTQFRGRVQLGRDVTDTKITIGAAIKDVLDFAISEGLSFTYQQADLDALTTIPPSNERIDISCFEAVKHLLAWSPSVSTSVDYSSGSPVIRFVKRASASAVDVASESLAGLAVMPRPDLKVNGVVINFETTNTDNGVQYTTQTQQTSGSVNGLKVLKQTVQLAGVQATSTYQTAKVVTEVPDSTSADWWKKYIPGLSTVTGLTINSGTDPVELAAYPRVLVSGSVPEWTEEDTVEAEFRATVSGTYNGVALSSYPIAVRLVLTTASTKTYKQLVSSSFRPAETAPAGLADSIYAERSVLHYQGSATRPAATSPDFSVSTTNTINITAPEGNVWNDAGTWDDSAAWDDGSEGGVTGLSAINAIVEAVSIVIRPGAPAVCMTSISFGPPRHLGVQDFIELARATREIGALTWSRAGADMGDFDAVDASGRSPNHNGSSLGIGSGLPATSAKGDLLQGDGSGGVEVVTGFAEDDVLYFDATNGWTPLVKPTQSLSEPRHYLTYKFATSEVTWDPNQPDTLPTGVEGDMIIKGAAEWTVLHPTEASLIAGSSSGFTLIGKPTSGAAVAVYDAVFGGITLLALPTAAPQLIISQTDGSVDSVALGTSAELFYHNGSGGLTRIALSTASQYDLLQKNGSGGLEFDELKAT